MAQRRIAVYSDTPELQALSKGYARQAHQTHFARGYGEARMFGNELVMRATAVPEGDKAQIAFLAGRYGAYGDEGGQFLQPLTGVKLQAELGLTSPHFLNKAFEANIRPSPKGFQQSHINGLDVLRAYKHPKPPPVGRPSAILSPPARHSTTYGTISSAPINPAPISTTSPPVVRSTTYGTISSAPINPTPISPAVRATKSPIAVKAVQSPVVAAALAAYQTRSATHRAHMEERAAVSFARMARSPTYLVKTAAKFTEADRVDYMSKLVE